MSGSAGNDLLSAISHSGQVSWSQFESYVASILGDQAVPAFIRRSFSRLGHLDYFYGDYLAISASPSSVALLAPKDCIEGLLCGKRTDGQMEGIARAASVSGILLSREAQGVLPDRVTLKSSSESQLKSFAESLGLTWAGAASARIALCLPSMILRRSERVSAETLVKEGAQWLDFKTGNYLPQRSENITVCSIRKFNQDTAYFVRGEFGWRLPRYQAVYLAGAEANQAFLKYDSNTRVLSVPAKFPLPDLQERVLSLCSGWEPVFDNLMLNYKNIPAELADLIRSSLATATEEQ